MDADGRGGQGQLDGMPAPWRPRVVQAGGRTRVLHGPYAMFDIPDDDATLRNFAMVSMTESKVMSVKEAGAAFGLRPDHVSRLRSGYHQEGPAALVAKRPGRPPALSPEQVRQAKAWAAQRVSHAEIARRLGVPRSVVTETLRRHGGADRPQDGLFDEDRGGEDRGGEDRGAEGGDCGGAEGGDCGGEDCGGGGDAGLEPPVAAQAAAGPGGEAEAGAGAASPAAGARIEAGVFPSRFAGAMLVWAYTHRVGARGVLAEAAAASAGPGGLVFDDLGVLAAVLMAFSLGRVSVEQFKHLRGGQAGPLVGWDRLPSLRALRPRLGAIADAVDPVGLLGSYFRGILEAEPGRSRVFYADDHSAPRGASYISPVQPGGTWREVPGSDGLPGPERRRELQHARKVASALKAFEAGRYGTRAIWLTAGLPKPQSPGDANRHPPERRPMPVPRPAST